jgi:outer membrane protein OmpA-like peptidoglycan-associated protein
MKKCFVKILRLMLLVGLFGLAANVWAMEIITEDDIREGVIVNLDLIKRADNAVILFDSSSSMNKPYKDTGMTRYDIAKKMLIERNQYFPDLGYNFGLYLYTPWKAVYPVQKYDKAKFAQALKTLPEKATTATFLTDGLRKLDSILKKLEGRTAVFLFTDRSDTNKGGGRKKPSAIAQELAKKYNVCFYIISTADDYYSTEIFNRVQDFNFCSRVIAYEDFVEHPAFNSEALFTVKATKEIVTFTDKRVVGIKTNDFLFDFDKFDLDQDEQDRLQVLAAFLKENKAAYAALAGHTDSIGTEDYNMELSYKRVEMISRYLVENLQVDKSQILEFWFGKLNPVADNSTKEGRMQNRRVEILVGGM